MQKDARRKAVHCLHSLKVCMRVCLHLTLPPPESCLVRRSTLMAVVTIMLVAINIFGRSGITTMKKLLNG